ncbi:MAG: hypothetical protein VX519_01645 [Myxococcota bacterium]|nr:hypothetical protein [Myxococcota bacterium]
MRALGASLLLAQVMPSMAMAQDCGADISAVADVQSVEGALFPEQFLGQEDHIRWGTYGSDGTDEGSWADFIWESVKKVNLDGVVDRYLEVQRIEEAIKEGANPNELGIPETHYRLQNVAQMQHVIEQAGQRSGGLAAHSLRDANSWFYTLFGNDSGSFRNMDMARYREIGAMQANEAAEVLPDFEADTFRRSGDQATADFGNSLSPEQRRDLFKLHSEWFAPARSPHLD